MKAKFNFTASKGLKVIVRYFKTPTILKVWEEPNHVEILFEADGKQWELLSTTDPYFTAKQPYTIFEA